MHGFIEILFTLLRFGAVPAMTLIGVIAVRDLFRFDQSDPNSPYKLEPVVFKLQHPEPATASNNRNFIDEEE